MPDIIVDPLWLCCSQLFSRTEIQESQQLAPDPLASRGRERRERQTQLRSDALNSLVGGPLVCVRTA